MYWILLLGLALALVLQAILIKSLWSWNLSVRLRFRDRYIYEGESSALQEIVANDKWLPLPALEVRIALNKNLEFTGASAENSGVSDQTYKRDVFSFLFHQQITRTLSFIGKKRGCYELKTVDIKSCDFFFRPLGYESRPQNAMLYVYPGQVDLSRLNLITTAISGTVPIQNKLFPDPFEFSGIREYQPTDPLNRMNWKATMRTGIPLVNQFDSTTNLNLTLLFDVEDTRIMKEDALVEETIRITSSLCARLVSARMPVCLYGNAHFDHGKNELFSMHLAAGAGRMDELNRQLACIDGAVMSCPRMLDTIDLSNHDSRIYVLISKNTDEEMCQFVQSLAHSKASILWVIPILSHGTRPELKLSFVKTIFWEVEL